MIFLKLLIKYHLNFLLITLIKRGIIRRKKNWSNFKEGKTLWARNNFNLSLEDFEVIIKKILYLIRCILLLKFQNFSPEGVFTLTILFISLPIRAFPIGL